MHRARWAESDVSRRFGPRNVPFLVSVQRISSLTVCLRSDWGIWLRTFERGDQALRADHRVVPHAVVENCMNLLGVCGKLSHSLLPLHELGWRVHVVEALRHAGSLAI